MKRNLLFSLALLFPMLFTGYLGMLLGGALVGLGEYEYSWQPRQGGSG